MKKVIIIVTILVCGTAGFLYYDWHVQTKEMAAEPKITLYSWTDENGVKHFTDTAPPQGARDVQETKGNKYVEPPLVVKIKHKSIAVYEWIISKIFKQKEKKEKRKK
ncbi:MAG: DUF4124 domain-containing protein [Desulfobacterales bacterium]|nr:MAG: DUF4124 domain-containing protein [Desulfobacterales bacterium]